MRGSAWRSYWGVFGVLLVAVALVAAWRMAVTTPVPRAQTQQVNRAGMLPVPATSQAAASNAYRGMIVPAGFMRAPSGKLLPRFASLALPQAQVRLGPGEEYPVAWIIRSPDIPLEVLAEAGGWLRIRDHEGEEGWIRARALDSARRTALVAPWRQDARLALRQAPAEDAALRAWVSSGVVVRVLSCDGTWCRVQAGNVHGWLRQPQLWGVYRDEHIRTGRS